MVNPKYCEILGRTEQEPVEPQFQSITHPDDLAVNLDNCGGSRKGSSGISKWKKGISAGWFGSLGGDRGCGNVAGGWNPSLAHGHSARHQLSASRRGKTSGIRASCEGLEEMIVVVDRDYAM